MAGHSIYRLDVRPGAKPLNLSAKLNAVAPGKDEYVSVSRNGKFIALSTTRFRRDCAGWACLTLLNEDLSLAAPVLVHGKPVRSTGRVSVSNDGNIVVYASDDGPHAQDLYVLRKERNHAWQAPQRITDSSEHAYNTAPVLSPDEKRILFDCGPVPYSQGGTGVCEVNVDGTFLRRVVDPTQGQGSGDGDFLACHGDYLADGTIVFEANWSGEQIWFAKRNAKPILANSKFSNDNAPCVLPGGYLASLWLERPGSSGQSEIKIMQPDGSDFSVITPNVQVSQINCHESGSER